MLSVGSAPRIYHPLSGETTAQTSEEIGRASLALEKLNMGENICASAPISADAYMGELLLHSESVERWLPD